MRRHMITVTALALLSLAVTAGPADAKVKFQESGSFTQLVAEWSSGDEDSWTSGFAQATTMNRQTTMYYSSYTIQPTGPGDEGQPCWEVSSTSAYGPAALTTTKKFETGYASGTLDAWSDSYVWCEGDWFEDAQFDGEGEFTIAVTIDFTSTTPLLRSQDSSSFKIPGQVHERSRFSSEYRLGEAVITADGTQVVADWAELGSVRFSYRYQSK